MKTNNLARLYECTARTIALPLALVSASVMEAAASLTKMLKFLRPYIF